MIKSTEELFEDIVAFFMADAKVSRAKMFGTPGLKVSNKVFAFLYQSKLVVKLPKERVDSLVNTKKGSNFGHMFAPGKWRPMKEWAALKSTSVKEWLTLAQEARDFVSSKIL